MPRRTPTIDLTLPAFWAPFVKDGNPRALVLEERVIASHVLHRHRVGRCVCVSDLPAFRWSHDATAAGVPAADCLLYTFEDTRHDH